ncbi:class I SAM-dependent methyltransferase [Anaerolineae bacterium CFX7]|nr:class I SAM-dependent methyltransferase [Anaerolineae bacterium CFX7]
MKFWAWLARRRYAVTNGFRRRRFDFFWERLGRYAGTRWWLDLGGGPGSYLLAELDALGQNAPRVVLLDQGEAELLDARRRFPHALCVRADGEHLPFRDEAFNLVFCNSVIEHVAHPEQLAGEIRRTGRRFFVQTPNGTFPLESHSHVPLPFFWRLPRRMQRPLCRLVGAQWDYLMSVHYLTPQELQTYFPGAQLIRERVWGLTKSYYLVTPPGARESARGAAPRTLVERVRTEDA